MDNTPKKNKVSGFHVAVIAILAAIFVLLAIVVVTILPRTTKILDKVNEELVTMEVIIEDADIAVKNINKIDFDNLSESIDSLHTIVTGMSKIFSAFK